jgi:hypothetical protein
MIFIPEWSKGEFVSFVGCILLSKSLSCNVAVLNRAAVYFKIFKVFREGYFSIQRRFYADSNSEKSDPLFPSGRLSKTSRHPSVSRSF